MSEARLGSSDGNEPTLAKKFEAVQRQTVAKSKPIPIVCRHAPLSPCFPKEVSLAAELCEVEDSVDLLSPSLGSDCTVGIGRAKFPGGTGGTGPLITVAYKSICDLASSDAA